MPELHVSPYCNDEDTNYFQQQIGVLCWIVKLGHIDICTEISMFASFLAAPREGHLSATFHVFAYLNGHDQSQLVMDPSYVHHSEEPSGDWAAFYPDTKEEIPVDAPPPHGKCVQITR